MKSTKLLFAILFFAAFLIIFAGWNSASANSTNSQIQGTILYVKPGANGTCTSWADACELQTALFNAASGDQIWVAAGTYKPSSSNRSATFQLKSGVAIYGGFPAAGGEWFQRNWITNLTTLSGDIGVAGNIGDNSYHVVTGSSVDGTAVLDGFTIKGGNANGNDWENKDKGGGMYNSGGSPTLSNVTFSENLANGYSSSGGGIYNNSSNPTLSNVTFSGNTCTGDYCRGGGMYNYGSSPNLTNVTFSSNNAGIGGGMGNDSSSPTLTNVTFSGNSATYNGGGMVNDYNSNPTLTNVTFNSNSASQEAGGMYNGGSNPNLSNVNFSGNTANFGGGMFNYGSSPSLTDVTFSNNSAQSNGGGMLNNGSSPSLTDVTFSNNSAQSGGGMFNGSSSSPILTNVTFSGNTTTNYGGGMSNDSSSPILTNVLFSGNTAVYGGGMYNYQSSSPVLTNVTFTLNSANIYGGGMTNEESSPYLTNVTFVGNSTNGMYGFGGGMDNFGYSNPTITNAIFWGNTPGQIGNSYSTPMITYSDIEGGYQGTGNIDADPLLGSLADNGGFTLTHALGVGSPAIDAGDPNICPAVDQRAYARPIDGNGDGTATCDMGAYEYASFPATFSLTIDIVGDGLITKDPDQTEYLWGEVVSLTPVADPDWVFIGWGGDASGMDNPLSVTIYEDTSITANFRFDAWTITLSVYPESSGEVVKYPDQPTYHYGDQVTLTALPKPGWSFAGWTGDASGTSSQIIVTMNDNLEITANFSQIEYSLSVFVNPPGMGTVTKSPNKPNYNYGDVVTLTADGVTGWWLESWSGDASGNLNPLTFTVVGNTDIVANFTDTYHTYLPAILK